VSEHLQRIRALSRIKDEGEPKRRGRDRTNAVFVIVFVGKNNDELWQRKAENRMRLSLSRTT
jgi:hypothetical protein